MNPQPCYLHHVSRTATGRRPCHTAHRHHENCAQCIWFQETSRLCKALITASLHWKFLSYKCLHSVLPKITFFLVGITASNTMHFEASQTLLVSSNLTAWEFDRKEVFESKVARAGWFVLFALTCWGGPNRSRAANNTPFTPWPLNWILGPFIKFYAGKACSCSVVAKFIWSGAQARLEWHCRAGIHNLLEWGMFNPAMPWPHLGINCGTPALLIALLAACTGVDMAIFIQSWAI